MKFSVKQLNLFSPEASHNHANHSLKLGKNKGKQMIVISGQKCLELFPKSDRIGLLLKMLLESSTWHSKLCGLTWKVRVTKWGALIYQLVPSMPRISGKEYGLWQTPLAEESGPRLETLISVDGKKPERGKRTLRIAPDGTLKRQTMTLNLQVRIEDGNNPLRALNPAWVCWLMGYPLDWTDLGGTENQISQDCSLEEGILQPN